MAVVCATNLSMFLYVHSYIDRFLKYIGDSTQYKAPSTTFDIPCALEEVDNSPFLYFTAAISSRISSRFSFSNSSMTLLPTTTPSHI